MRSVYLTGVLFFLSVFGWGQHYYSRDFTVNDGLPSNMIHSIVKDSRGMMWIGTGSGLCGFDGTGFKTWGSNDGLVGDNVFSITEDDTGNLWIGSMKGGVSKFDGKKFTNYTTKQGLVSDNVRVVWYSKKFHLLFIGTNEGCSVFDGESFVSLTTQDTKTPDFFVMGFLEGDDFVNIYPYLNTDYQRYYPSTRTFQKIASSYYPDHPTSASPLILPNGDTIMGSHREGINILNHGIKHSFKEMGQVFGMTVGEECDIWVAAWSENSLSKELPGGLFRFDGEQVYRYSEKVGINDPTVWCVYYDTSFHVLWVGTLNSGLFKIPLSAFEWYDQEDFGLKELNVKSLFVTKENTLWVGTKENLFFRRPNGEVTVFNPKRFDAFQIPGKNLPYNFSCIRQDSHRNIFASIFQTSVLRFSPQNNFSEPQFIQLQRGATSFGFDSHDTIYYTDKWGEGIYQRSLFPKVTEPTYFGSGKTDAPTNVVKIISTGDTIWYCSRTEGLFRSLYGKFDQFSKTDTTLPRIINDICFERQGNVVVGSNSGEVLIVRYETGGLKVKYRIQPEKDIIGNSVTFVVVDHTNHLFIGTNLGLNRVDLTTLYKSNNLLTNFYNSEVGYYDCSGKVSVVDQDGNIWVGTDSRLLRIDPTLLEKLSSIPVQPRITSLDVNYQSTLDFPEVFSCQENNLIVHFETVNYLNPGQTLYRYTLEGLSNRWSDFSTETKSIFTSLNPGKYQLNIESYNTLNNSRIGSVNYPFRIEFPWYQKWWFIVGMIILGVLMVWYIIRYRTDQIRREEKKKTEFSKRLAEIEMKALQSQMNPHFIFNSINSIQGFMLKHKVEEALGYLMDFSKILRQTLDNASREFITLNEEIEFINYYLNLELMRFDRKFTVDLRTPDDLNPQSVQIPPMIIQPYVENAIRHGLLHKKNGKGLLLIEFAVEGEEVLKCVIEDNGVGRKRSKEIESWKNQITHKPQSTRITQERIELLNISSRSEAYHINIIDLCDREGQGIGTRVEIILPLMIC